MKVERIASHEESFDAHGVDSDGKKHSLSNRSIAIPREEAEMKYVRVRPSSTGAISLLPMERTTFIAMPTGMNSSPGRATGGWDYFGAFTDAQYDSTIVLLRYLTARYGIPRAFLPTDARYETKTDHAGFRGIVSHVNYRKTGKTDIGPAFDWDRVIGGVQA